MRFFGFLAIGLARTQKIDSRGITFTDEVGYVAIDRGFQCLQKCGQKQNWAGFCDDCGLSNGSPGFCCHPDGRGHCSPAMINALNPAEGHQCVIPKTFSTDNVVQTRQLGHKPDCWSKCGKKKNWSGECSYCGPIGYCCHKDGRGSCPELLSRTVTDSRMQCVIPSQSRNELLFETEKRSDCYDRRETRCKRLEDVRNNARECREYFTSTECMSGLPKDDKPNCITLFTNYCEDISQSKAEKAREAAASDPFRNFDAYERELFRFFALNFPAAQSQIFNKISSTNFDAEEGDVDAMIKKVAPAYIMQQVKYADTERVKITFAILNALKPIWRSSGNKFGEIKFDLADDFSLSDLTRNKLTNMIQRNGGSWNVEAAILKNYKELILSVSDWGIAQTGFMATMNELPLSPKRLDVLRLANSKASNNDFSMLSDSIKFVMKKIHSDDSVSDFELDAIINTLQNKHVSIVIWNSAVYTEVERLIADQKLWGVKADPKSSERAFLSRISGDKYMQAKSRFTEQRMKDLLQIAAFYNGADVNIRNTAQNIADMFYEEIFKAGDRAVRTVTDLVGSKKIYKQLVQEFAENYKGNDLNKVFAEVFDSRMPSLRFGSAGDVFGKYLLTITLKDFSASQVYKVRQIMETDQWMVLDSALNAVSALDSDASVSDQELGASFGCDRKCDLGLKWFNPQFTRGMTRAGPNDIYAAVVMDYFNHLRPGPEDGTLEQAEGACGAPVCESLAITEDVLFCVSEALTSLPELTTNSAREEIYGHVMQAMYLKDPRDTAAIDVASAVLSSDAWIYGGAYVIETIMATEDAMTAAATLDIAALNAWDLSVIDWELTGKTEVELSPEYQTEILAGYNAKAGVDEATAATIAELQPDMFIDAVGKTSCTSSAFLQTTHWVCPEGHDPNIPGSAAEGCTAEQTVEEICTVYGYEDLTDNLNNMQALWGYQWFDDNLGMMAVNNSINGTEMSEIMGNVLQALGSMGSLGGAGDAAHAGDNFAAGMNAWFAENDANNSALIASLFESGAFEGLDWMLTASENMMEDFGGQNGTGGNGTGDWFNDNGDSYQNGYWSLFDMVDLAAGANGTWDLFGSEFNGGNASYANASFGWWNDWVNSQDDWGPNGQALFDKWGSQSTYNEIRNGTKDIYPPGIPGPPGTPSDPVWLTAESVEWPFPAACVEKTYTEDIIEYFDENGKSDDVLAQISTIMASADFTLSCNSVDGLLTQTITQWYLVNDITTFGASVQTCLEAPHFTSLVARIEMQLKVAKNWTADIGTEQEFEALNWDWVTFDLTDEDLTEEFIQENLEQNEDLTDLFTTIDINEFSEEIFDLVGKVIVTTTTTTATTTVAADTTTTIVGDTTTTVVGDTTTTVAGDTTTTVAGDTTTTVAGDTTTTVAGATTTTVVGATTTTVVEATTTTVVGATTTVVEATTTTVATTTTTTLDGGLDGDFIDPYAPADGTGLVSGDPHVKVQSLGQPAVCFDIIDVDHTILDLLSDPSIGLEVNGQIFNEGHGTTRLERIFVRSPAGIQLEIQSDLVELSIGDQVMTSIGFYEERQVGQDDIHVQILTRSSNQRKNGVIITINHNIQFHVAIKNGKASLRFEILNSSGLATSGLTGIIGQGILPHDYTVNVDGDITIGDRVIKNTELVWNEHDFCRQIRPAFVQIFLGHSVHDYRVPDKFSVFSPTWLEVQQVLNASPK